MSPAPGGGAAGRSRRGALPDPGLIAARGEGSLAYGLSPLLYGACTVEGVRMQQGNFDTYRAMRLNEMPAVATIVMPSGGFWGGVGEPTIAVAAPPALNAAFAATGERVRTAPPKNVDLRRA